MKSLLLALSFAVSCAGLAPAVADAKRIGGGGSSGMQRSMPARTPSPATPAQPAQAVPTAPLAGAAPAAAAAPKRSWMGPIAGLAAGLGIAALMSHLGMGAAFGNAIMLALLAVVAFVAIRFAMGRFARSPSSGSMATPNGMQFAGGAPAPVATGASWSPTSPSAVLIPPPRSPWLAHRPCRPASMWLGSSGWRR